jgi:predicted histone-like DNA-binding protein
MAIKFKVIAKKNPRNPEAPIKYYAHTALDGEVGLEELCKEIEKSSTVSEADIMAVLYSLIAIVPEKLANSRIVRIGELGDLRPSIKSTGHENEKDVNASSIKKNRVLFRPGKRIKKAMKAAEYKKA